MLSQSPSHRMERVLAATHLFAGLDAELLSELAARATVKKLVRGERLWRAGDPARQFHLIQSGMIKILRRGPDGSEAIIGLFGPRESVGDVAVIGRRAYPAEAVVASNEADVVRVDAESVLGAMASQLEVAARMNSALVARTQVLHAKIGVMSAGTVPKRLATLLLSLAEHFGDEHEDGSLSIPVALSRSELASLVSARVETTIRTIRAWERAKVVLTEPTGFVLLDPGVLQRLVRAEDEPAD